MLLNELFKNAPNIEIKDITVDSRKTMTDGIFFCIKGFKTDGHKYVKEAINNGAKVIVYQDDIDTSLKAIYIKVDDVVKVLNQVAKKFFADPSNELEMFGVTGTNGKTTIAMLLKQVLDGFEPCGYIGTLGVEYLDKRVEANLTTPPIIDLNRYLKAMVDSNVRASAVEVSSIGIEQKRIDSIHFDVAIFTNFTHDHLDYHGTMENYFNSKKRFFDRLPFGTIAITNADDPVGLKIVEDTKAHVVTYGIKNEADYRASDIKMEENGTSFVLEHEGRNYLINTNLVAMFNVYNLLALIAALSERGYDLDTYINRLRSLKAVPGRMHKIEEGQNFNVIVDFAHTPDGLRKVFEYAQKITPSSKNIISVFGSAGGRDRSKRKIFGELADNYCDKIILTEDDPRDENPVDIAKEIAKGIKIHEYVIVETREEAIACAISMMNSGDTLLVLGKGDEDFIYRSFGKEPYLGDDKVAAKYIKKMKEEKNETGKIY